MLAAAAPPSAFRMADDVLIYSLNEHRELIFECLDVVAPRRVVEIGSEAGGMSREMVTWAEEHESRFVTIEPYPIAEIRELDRTSDAFELVEGRSPEALERVDPADVYLVDGDHNHWTVLHELRAIYAHGEPVTILHDVGWPCARRDQYYSVESLPPEAVHPHSFSGGRVPGQGELAEFGGFGGAGQFAVALEEGGPRNGVLTAVEDFLAEREGLAYAHVPAVFGLGIVYSTSAPYAGRLGDLLAPLDRNPLLDRIERNRVKLYSALLGAQHHRRSVDRSANRVLLGYAERLAELEAENTSLRLERGKLRAAIDAAEASGG
ncbi:MAG: hypothetical protein QOC95_2044 [Thermoleophilaceae bacterium]|jgi:hypothetical protein|nr:hypothetical protein [Thermoleophilaceae bacterium]